MASLRMLKSTGVALLLLAVAALSLLPSMSEAYMCTTRYRYHILMDHSPAMSKGEFSSMKDFARGFIERANNSQFMFSTYGNDFAWKITTHGGWNTLPTARTVLNGIQWAERPDWAPAPASFSYTGFAIDRAMGTLFPGDTWAYHHIIVLLTKCGGSCDPRDSSADVRIPLLSAANAAKNGPWPYKIVVVAVGLGLLAPDNMSADALAYLSDVASPTRLGPGGLFTNGYGFGNAMSSLDNIVNATCPAPIRISCKSSYTLPRTCTDPAPILGADLVSSQFPSDGIRFTTTPSVISDQETMGVTVRAQYGSQVATCVVPSVTGPFRPANCVDPDPDNV